MNKVIFSKFRSLLGGRMKMLLSGGAPLAEESQNFVRTVLCTTLHQGYGLTESTANGAVIDRDDLTLGSVGTPLLGVDFKLVSWKEGGYLVTNESGPQGEIHMGGDIIAKGYFEMP